ncbi:DUF1588 domain-containing protein [Rhodopirellula sp.]|nr:DUF1588 domain-containing protein [Rhodopirellula sp.]
MRQVVFQISALCLTIAATTACANEADLDNSHSLELLVKPFLSDYCIACHDDREPEGGLRLSPTDANEQHLLNLQDAATLDLWQRVLQQLKLNAMPPKDESQPPETLKNQIVNWIESQLKKSGRVANKLHQFPHYGNYVDHEKLFSGEVTEAAWSPARLWRRSPEQFELAKRTYFGVHPNPNATIGEIDNLKQPFNKGGEEGIEDYASLFYADSATFDTLYRNAAFLVDRTLLMAFIEYDYRSQGKTLDDWRADRELVLQAQQAEIEQYKKEGKTIRYISAANRALNAKYNLETPDVYRDIILGDGNPSLDQMHAAIRFHFDRTGQQEPTSDDLDKFSQFMRNEIAETGSYFGLRNALIAILVSPKYIYRSELGLGPVLADGRSMLAPAETAYAISYALTDEKPDDLLVKAATTGRLQTRDDVRREVERLLDDDNIDKPRILRFFHEFFGYNRAPDVFKDDDRFHNGFTFFKIATQYVNDTDTLVLHILKQDKNVIQELLSTNKYFIGHSGDNAAVQAEIEAHENLYEYFRDKPWKNYASNARVKEEPTSEDLKYAQSLHPDFRSTNGALKSGDAIFKKMKSLEPFESKGITPFTYSLKRSRDAQFKGLMAYNLNGYDWDFPAIQPFVLDQGKRAGILSHPSWLIAHSLNASTDPVRRGKWIRERLLAGTIPDIPITVDASVPEDPHKTLRERYAVTEAESCWKCHVKMNPLGYSFEMFDDFGRWRNHELLEGLPKVGRDYQTKPVNSVGWLKGTEESDLDGKVTDAIDLVNRLARSRRVQQSFIRHAFRYWMGRNEMLSDSKTLIAAEDAYIADGGSFRAMLVSLLTSDSFIYRKQTDE